MANYAVRGLGVVLLLLIASTSFARGAFGVLAGDDPEKLVGCVRADGSEGFYRCSQLPEPNSAFSAYTITAKAAPGVTKVSGLTASITASPSGEALRGRADELAAWITKTYGGSIKRYDQYRPYVEKVEGESWMGALADKRREYVYVWTQPQDEIQRGFPDRIARITLSAHADAKGGGWLELTYSFDNADP